LGSWDIGAFNEGMCTIVRDGDGDVAGGAWSGIANYIIVGNGKTVASLAIVNGGLRVDSDVGVMPPQ